MRKFLSLTLLFLLFSGYAKYDSASAVIPQDGPETAEYAVYAALLKETAIDKETTQLVIEERTETKDYMASGPPGPGLIEQLPPLKTETLEDFVAKNEKPHKLTDQFNLKVKINFIGKIEVQQIFKDDTLNGWKVFHQRYPTARAIYTLSRVGFNADMAQALVFIAYSCGGLCGQGQYVLLTKREGEWKIEKKFGTWIS